MAESVRPLTRLHLGSGHDVTVCEMEPCADRVESAWDALSLPPSPSPMLSLSLSLKINKLKKMVNMGRLGGSVN